MDLAVLRTTVCREAAQFAPELLTPVGATVAVEHWAAMERACASAKLRAALTADDAGLDGDGIVAGASGTTGGKAKRQKRAARAATRKPGPLADAFRNGQLSPEQTDAITAAVDADPDAEDASSGWPNGPAADLIEECDRTRDQRVRTRGGDLADEQKARRYLRHWKDADGMTRIDGALEPVAGATLVAALQPARRPSVPRRGARQDRRRDPRTAFG